MELMDLIDKIDELEKKRDRVVGLFDEQIQYLRTELEAQMKAAHTLEAYGRHGAKATRRKQKDVRVHDWLRFFEWVAQKKAWDVLQKRVSSAALRARLDHGEKVPEVEIEEKEILVITRKKETF
ncbi:MAG: hypothetical protein ACUVWY_15210 [Desulfosoma sp.]|uniref:hypothetical protein n=1 Tax=Desulfosoma sp. TaxID=2603217 RepID=UPI004049F16E